PVDLPRSQVRIAGRPAPADLLADASLAALAANPHVPTCNDDGTTNPDDGIYWYGLGLLENKYGNAWHTGSLPGTTTEDVIASNGYSWAAFFNSRPRRSDDFFKRLDGDLWTALDGATDLAGGDLFDQYGDFGPCTH